MKTVTFDPVAKCQQKSQVFYRNFSNLSSWHSVVLHKSPTFTVGPLSFKDFPRFQNLMVSFCLSIVTTSCAQVLRASPWKRPLLTQLRAMSGSSPAAQTLQLDGSSTVSYRVDAGAGSGPPCLLLPGALGTAMSDFAGQFGPEGINKGGRVRQIS